MARTKVRPWDPAEHLVTEEDMAAYLEAALEEGDAALVARCTRRYCTGQGNDTDRPQHRPWSRKPL